MIQCRLWSRCWAWSDVPDWGWRELRWERGEPSGSVSHDLPGPSRGSAEALDPRTTTALHITAQGESQGWTIRKLVSWMCLKRMMTCRGSCAPELDSNACTCMYAKNVDILVVFIQGAVYWGVLLSVLCIAQGWSLQHQPPFWKGNYKYMLKCLSIMLSSNLSFVMCNIHVHV